MYSLSGTYSTGENMVDNKEIALRVSRLTETDMLMRYQRWVIQGELDIRRRFAFSASNWKRIRYLTLSF